jgi:predicted ATP-grasp superfamily ATP-dependent carboligase
VGRQIIAQRSGRFAYEGGVVPHPLDDEAEIISAVESVAGLLGWVGVDFVREESTGRIIVLEINPRVTTSYVGWRAVHPSSRAIAWSWLEMVRKPRFFEEWRRLTPGIPTSGLARFSADGAVERVPFS